MSKIEPVLLSRKDTMAMVGVRAYDTFRKLLADGVIPAGIPVGGRLRWDREAILAA